MNTESSSGESRRAFHVMVVDDDAALRRLYELKLAEWPMQPLVTTFADGWAAMIRMERIKPDMLILDLKMPEMDGFRMLQHMRELSAAAIVVVSGLNSMDIAENGCIPAGIQVLQKPVPFDRLQRLAEALASQTP